MHRILLPIFLLTAAPMIGAQQVRTSAPRGRAGYATVTDDGDRAMLGISTSSSGKRDTLGLLVESVMNGSPAEKAGLEEGNRIAAVNGVNLKLSRDDAGESDMSGTMTNRLTREMRKLKAGDDVSLEVWNGSRYRTLKVKTVAADDLEPQHMTRADMEDRPVLGVSLGSNGSKRDTLGVFVSSVTDGGPADKAGLMEGDRIASINGIDLRVPKEDVGDYGVASSRVQRLQREVRKLKAGQTVDLAVVDGGRTRTVKVTLGRAKDFESTNGFSFSSGDGSPRMFSAPMAPMAPFSPMAPMAPLPPIPPMEPMAPMAPMAPHARVRVFDDDGAAIDFSALRDRLRDIGPEVRAEIESQMPQLRMQLDRDMPMVRMQLDHELPMVRMQFDREVPQAMDEVRRSLQRLRDEMPLLRARIGHGVII